MKAQSPDQLRRKALIVNADDLGLSENTNWGILRAHAEGIVSSTTVLINMPHAEHGLHLARKEAPALGVGLHLNITLGTPLSPPSEIPTLTTGSGEFFSMFDVNSGRAALSTDEIYREFSRQLEHFCDLFGELPDHLDSHHFVTLLHPGCFQALNRLSEEHALRTRAHDDAAVAAVYDFAARTAPKNDPVRLPPANTPKMRQDKKPTLFLELGFFADTGTSESLLRIIDCLPEGATELMCHPGLLENSSELYGAQLRYQELTALTDPTVKNRIAEANVKLMTFRELDSCHA